MRPTLQQYRCTVAIVLKMQGRESSSSQTDSSQHNKVRDIPKLEEGRAAAIFSARGWIISHPVIRWLFGEELEMARGTLPVSDQSQVIKLSSWGRQDQPSLTKKECHCVQGRQTHPAYTHSLTLTHTLTHAHTQTHAYINPHSDIHKCHYSHHNRILSRQRLEERRIKTEPRCS